MTSCIYTIREGIVNPWACNITLYEAQTNKIKTIIIHKRNPSYIHLVYSMFCFVFYVR